MRQSQATRKSGNSVGHPMTERAAKQIHEGVDRLAVQSGRLEEQLRTRGGKIGESTRELGGDVKRLVQQNPWAVLGGTIAIGFLLGAMYRR